ncbi:hypothetical protein D3C76_1746630 [compost metagenome]
MDTKTRCPGNQRLVPVNIPDILVQIITVYGISALALALQIIQSDLLLQHLLVVRLIL